MPSSSELLTAFVLLWAVIDPIGTVPVFLAATRDKDAADRRRIARIAAISAAGVLLFFIVVGEVLLRMMGVSLEAFQVAGGLVLFLFALTMIFGESKPDQELRHVRSAEDIAVFPLAMPSIASPGAMMAVVLLTENKRHSLQEQAATTAVMLLVVLITYLTMRSSAWVGRVIGTAGAGVASRVMGLLLASIAATQVLEGLRLYFT